MGFSVLSNLHIQPPCLTWVSLTEGRVSLPEIWVGFILGINPPGIVTATPPKASGLSWELVVDRGCREIGLCGPLLEPEEDLRLINAISTVGSGLCGHHIQTTLNTLQYADTNMSMNTAKMSYLSFVLVNMLLASSYVTPIKDSLLIDTSWSPAFSLPSLDEKKSNYEFYYSNWYVFYYSFSDMYNNLISKASGVVFHPLAVSSWHDLLNEHHWPFCTVCSTFNDQA